MTRTIAALLAAATLAGIAAPAAAQTKYYARERIVGMPTSSSSSDASGSVPSAPSTGTPAFDGTWTSSEGASYCSGRVRQKDVALSCNGTSCDPSNKPSTNPIVVGSCTSVCQSKFTNGKWGSGTATSSAPAGSESLAIKYCQDMNAPGACGWLVQYKYAYFFADQTSTVDAGSGLAGLVCRMQ
jgi:hypothetical protein